MTKYYFHLLTGRQLIVDREPIELPDLDAAMKHAHGSIALEVDERGGTLTKALAHKRVRWQQ